MLTSPRSATRVTPQVREVSLERVDRPQSPDLAARSAPTQVSGFGVVGATWSGKPPKGLRLAIRSKDRGSWSPWTKLELGDGISADSAEGRQVRMGSNPLALGEVDSVQLRAASATGRAPHDLELSVIDPGRSPLDDASAQVATTAGRDGAFTYSASNHNSWGPDHTVDTRGVRAPLPLIRLRRAWGANERMRSTSPRYGRVTAGFVHHTVNANYYSRSDVPAIIRGIYAYHTQSLGWSDIGYNFLVDRFGRKWVGRYGGPRRAVIGAHTYGYNHLSTGMAAIGNFQTRQPPEALIRAMGRMQGWKLGLAGVSAADRYRWMEGRRFRTISGHRDAGQTACPGYYLYQRLAGIRREAVSWQQR